jgi:hypothetical protein
MLFLAQDNTLNCNATAEELQLLICQFCGKKWRIWCLFHIINLIAKVRHAGTQ